MLYIAVSRILSIEKNHKCRENHWPELKRMWGGFVCRIIIVIIFMNIEHVIIKLYWPSNQQFCCAIEWRQKKALIKHRDKGHRMYWFFFCFHWVFHSVLFFSQAFRRFIKVSINIVCQRWLETSSSRALLDHLFAHELLSAISDKLFVESISNGKEKFVWSITHFQVDRKNVLTHALIKEEKSINSPRICTFQHVSIVSTTLSGDGENKGPKPRQGKRYYLNPQFDIVWV